MTPTNTKTAIRIPPMAPPAATAPMLLDGPTVNSVASGGIDGDSGDRLLETSDEAATKDDNVTVEDLAETPKEAVIVEGTIVEDGKITKSSETKDVIDGETNNTMLDSVVVPVLDV